MVSLKLPIIFSAVVEVCTSSVTELTMLCVMLAASVTGICARATPDRSSAERKDKRILRMAIRKFDRPAGMSRSRET